jgi:hypothetical protein
MKHLTSLAALLSLALSAGLPTIADEPPKSAVTVTALPQEKEGAIKAFQVSLGTRPLGTTGSLQGDTCKQSLETDLQAGVQTLSVRPAGGWKQDAPLSIMQVVALDPQ